MTEAALAGEELRRVAPAGAVPREAASTRTPPSSPRRLRRCSPHARDPWRELSRSTSRKANAHHTVVGEAVGAGLTRESALAVLRVAVVQPARGVALAGKSEQARSRERGARRGRRSGRWSRCRRRIPVRLGSRVCVGISRGVPGWRCSRLRVTRRIARRRVTRGITGRVAVRSRGSGGCRLSGAGVAPACEDHQRSRDEQGEACAHVGMRARSSPPEKSGSYGRGDPSSE